MLNLVTDPYGLLAGAGTTVPAAFNPPLGAFSSKVTAIMFHTNVPLQPVNGSYAYKGKPIPNDPGLPGYDASKPRYDYQNRDGSIKYLPSYLPDGLVEDPVGVEKTVNGVDFIEYTGELSGYINSSNDPGTVIVYGPIGAPYEPPDWTIARQGLKGICFILKIPKKKNDWNGVLVVYHAGAWPSSVAIYNNELDEIYLVSQGYAHASSFASGYESPTDTNHNNDEYWEYVVKSPGAGADTCRLAATKKRAPVSTTNMYTRDFAAVMKNLCGYAKGNQPVRTYYNARSATGDAALPLDTGRRSTDTRYYGNNYIAAFSNCTHLPNGNPNPDYDPNAAMVFDGFLIYSPGNEYTRADLDPRVPISPAPMIVLAGETDLPATRFGGLLLPYYAYRAKYDLPGHQVYGGLWPEPKDTFFNYSFEHFPHFPQLTTIYALAKNGGGKFAYIDANGNMTFNNQGKGKELDRNWGRMVDTFDYLGVPFTQTAWWKITYVNYSAPCSLGGVCHQMLDNLHQYVTTGKRPPASNIDPYLFEKNTYPKFAPWDATPPRLNRDVIDTATPTNYGPTATIDLSTHIGGLYRTVIDYIDAHGQAVLNFQKTIWRTPDDAARRGLYRTYGPFFEYIDRPFTAAELVNGFPALDWDGQPLVTMTLPSGKKIPQDGYKSHGEYVSAVTDAVHSLVKNRMYDQYLGMLLVAAAAQALP